MVAILTGSPVGVFLDELHNVCSNSLVVYTLGIGWHGREHQRSSGRDTGSHKGSSSIIVGNRRQRSDQRSYLSGNMEGMASSQQKAEQDGKLHDRKRWIVILFRNPRLWVDILFLVFSMARQLMAKDREIAFGVTRI